MTTHHIELPRQSWRILAAHLNAGGEWCNKPRLIRDAAAVLDLDAITAQETAEPPKDNAAAKAWLEAVFEAELTEGMREAAKACLAHHAGKGQLPPHRYTARLLDAFGIE